MCGLHLQNVQQHQNILPISTPKFLGQLYAGGENLWQSANQSESSIIISFHGTMENNLFMHILMDDV